MPVHHILLLLSRSSFQHFSYNLNFNVLFAVNRSACQPRRALSLTFWIVFFAVIGTDAPTLLDMLLGIYPNQFYTLSLNTSLRILRASPAAATFRHAFSPIWFAWNQGCQVVISKKGQINPWKSQRAPKKAKYTINTQRHL